MKGLQCRQMRAVLAGSLRRGMATGSSSRGFSLPDIWLKQGNPVPGLLSEKGADIAWFQYQRHLLNEINNRIGDYTDLPNSGSILALVHASLQKSDNSDIRKIASLACQAYVNEFFFTALRPSPVPEHKVKFSPITDKELELQIELENQLPTQTSNDEIRTLFSHDLSLSHNIQSSFGSLQKLTDTLVERGSAIFGNGAVWLVSQQHRLAVVNTYSWGVPINTAPQPKKTTQYSPLLGDDRTTTPLLCLNAWQHIYLHDYGVKGKRRYLQNLVECINWDVVARRTEPMHF